MSSFKGALQGGAAVFALAFSSVSGSASALAQTQQQAGVSLPTDSLGNSLRALSRQTNVEILVDPALTDGKRAPEVRSAPDAEVALAQLLRGSGLTFEKRGGAYLIFRADSTRNAEAGTVALSAGEQGETLKTAEPIVVTGSRIARPELESAMPIDVVNMDAAERFGRTTAYDALRNEPGIGSGIGPATSFGESWDAGISTVSLRNLGTNRSLTLIDGMRRVSGSAQSSAVDLAMIPSAMIERIEVVTGGAAAIYGADAVSGAINIITKNEFNGFELSLQDGISTYGDMSRPTVSAIAGGQFNDDRGSFVIGGTYTESPELRISDRSFSEGASIYLANAENTGPDDGIPDQLLVRDFRGLYISPVPTFYYDGNSYLYQNGELVQGYYDDQIWGGQYSVGTGGNAYPAGVRGYMLYQKLDSFAVVSRLNYGLTDGIAFNARIDYGRTRSIGRSENYRDDSRKVFLGGAGGAVAYLNNPYLPEDIRDYMVDRGLTSLNIDRVYANFPRKEESHERQQLNLFASLEGTLADRFDWQAYGQYGRSQDDVETVNAVYRSHWVAARDAIADPVTGAPICRDEAARAAGCVPFDIFGTDPVTAEQLAWATGDRMERRVNEQRIFGASVTGALASLPHGDISFFLGAEHRTESLLTKDSADELGTELIGPGLLASHPEFDESFSVSEVFGELVIPILSNVPFAHRLEMEGAYRYSHYDTFGETNTWKAGAVWSPVRGLTFRGARSRSVRAPNFGELYAPAIETVTGSINDPCKEGLYNNSRTRAANCAALGITTPLVHYSDAVLVTTGGNPDLNPETSNSLTLGAVIQPAFLPGLNVTADYWDIDISGVISQFSYLNVLNLCVDIDTIDNVFCKQVVRGEDGKVQHVYSNQINASRMRARGIDAAFDYRTALGEGTLGLTFKGTYLLEKLVETTPGIETGNISYDGGIGDPRFRGNLTISYDIANFSAAVDTRFISASMVYPNHVSAEYVDVNRVPSRTYNDISVRYAFPAGPTLGLGVNNVLNVEPPKFPGAEWGANGLYDTIGRYFFASANIRF